MEKYSAIFGVLGVAPDGICSYLKSQKIECRRQDITSDNYVGFVGKHIEDLSEGQQSVFIITYWNDKNDITEGAHTVMFTVDRDGLLTAYNGNRDFTNGSRYENAMVLFTRTHAPARPISIIYVGRA